MLLSIGMIVKNEEKHLHNCLTSMLPILQNVKSELIIFDTGSTDSTVEIARKFTKNVHQIEWRNDFAWARNHTLDAATGKWFMYVDADEVFTDTADLVAFFNSGEYKKFKCATYKWRNVHSDDTFSYCRVGRLFKLGKSMQFSGKIHEYLPASLPRKDLNSIADHFGYHSDNIDFKAKLARNLPPMLEMHKENPKDERTIFHILSAYNSGDASTEELDEMKKFIDIGLKLTNGDQKKIYHHVFCYMMVVYLSLREDLEGIVSTVDKYMRELKCTHQAVVHMLSAKATSLHTLKRYTEAAKTSEQAMELIDTFKQLDFDITLILPLDDMVYKDNVAWLKNIIGNYTLAGDYVSALKWADVFIYEHPAKLGEVPHIANIFKDALIKTKTLTDDTEKMKLHEAAVRVGHKYFSATYSPDVYCAGKVESLPPIEGYIFYAGEAYAYSDKGDTQGFIRSMKQAALCMQNRTAK